MELAEAIVSPSPILPLRGSFSLGLLVRCRIRLWNGLRPTMKVLLFDKLLRDPIPSLSTAEDIDWPNMFTAKDVEGAFQKALGRRCLLVLFFALQAHYDALAALQQQQPPPQRQQRSLPSSVSDRDAAVNRVVSYSKGHKSLLFELLTGPAALTPALWSNVHVDVLQSLPTAFAAMLCLWRKCGTLKPSAFLCTDTEEHALRALQKRMFFCVMRVCLFYLFLLTTSMYVDLQALCEHCSVTAGSLPSLMSFEPSNLKEPCAWNCIQPSLSADLSSIRDATAAAAPPIVAPKRKRSQLPPGPAQKLSKQESLLVLDDDDDEESATTLLSSSSPSPRGGGGNSGDGGGGAGDSSDGICGVQTRSRAARHSVSETPEARLAQEAQQQLQHDASIYTEELQRFLTVIRESGDVGEVLARHSRTMEHDPEVCKWLRNRSYCFHF